METPRAEMITVRATTVVEPASPEADSAGALDVRVCAMRTGIIVKVTAAERDRLKAIVADRSSRQKHVWRAGIVLATAEGLGTVAIMQRTAKSKTAVWRLQERFAQEGVDGLLRDKTRARAASAPRAARMIPPRCSSKSCSSSRKGKGKADPLHPNLTSA